VFLSQTFSLYKAVFVTGVKQLAHGFDTHFAPDGGNLFWAYAFYAHHFNYPAGVAVNKTSISAIVPVPVAQLILAARLLPIPANLF
jgi:hypothetical protein